MRFGTQRLTALHVAAGEGHDEICETLLAKGADQRTVDIEGNTALMLATQQSRLTTLWVLTEHAGRCYAPSFYDTVNTRGLTAMHVACNSGDLASVSCLLKAGADPNIPMKGIGQFGQIPIAVAVLNGHEDVVAALLTAECRLDTVDEHKGEISLLNLAILLNQPKIVRLLIEHEVNIETGYTAKAGQPNEMLSALPTPLLVSAAFGRVECLQELLKTTQSNIDHCIDKGGRIDLLAPVLEKVSARIPETPENPMSWAIQYPCKFVIHCLDFLCCKGHVHYTTGIATMTKEHFQCVNLLLLSGAGLTGDQLLVLQENITLLELDDELDDDIKQFESTIKSNLSQCLTCGLFGFWADTGVGNDIQFCSQLCRSNRTTMP